MIMSIFNRIGVIVSKLNLSSVFNNSFVLIYQYDGRIWAIFKTESGNSSIGTKAPHKKQLPRATTLTIPLIAFLLFMAFPIKKAIDKAQIEKTKEFKI